MKINPKGSYYKWEVLLLLWMAYLLNQADRQVFNTVLPAIRDSLNLTDTSVGLIATIFSLFYALMVPIGGWAGDRFSRKWVTTISILFWSFATMFTGLASTVFMLILMRSIATGGGEAFFGPANYSLLGQYHTGSVGVVWGVIMIFGLKDMPKDDFAAQPALEAKPGILDGFKTVFSTPTALALTLGFSGFIFVITGYMTWVPAFLQEEFGQTQEMAGFHSMFWTYLAAFIGVLIAGWVSDKIGAKNHKFRMIIQGIGLLGGSVFLIFMGKSTTLWILYFCFAGWGLFRAFFDAQTYTILYDVTPPRLHASCSSAMITTGFAVGALAPVILGAMKQNLGSLKETFPVLGIVWIVCSVMMFVISYTSYQKDYNKNKNGQN